MLSETRLLASNNTRHRYVVLLVHDGGPADLSYAAVARFLASELSSRRVIDTVPRWVWLPTLYTLVLPWHMMHTRKLYEASWFPRAVPRSASSYAFWLGKMMEHTVHSPTGQKSKPPGGAMSVYYCRQLVDKINRIVTGVHEDACQRAGRPLLPGELSVEVEIGFTHQAGSIDAALDRVRLFGNYAGIRDSMGAVACVEEEHLVVLPLYPQYSSLRTAAAFDSLMASNFLRTKRSIPHLNFVRSYAGHPAYVRAIERRIRTFFAAHGAPDWLFFVFDGLPERFVRSGDLYQVECQRTHNALKELLSQPYVPPEGCEDVMNADGDSTDSSAGNSTSRLQDVKGGVYTRPFLSSRVTISFLGPPVGVEQALEPRTTRVLNSLAKQVRQMEANSRQQSAARGSGGDAQTPGTTGNPEQQTSQRRAMMGTLYFVCPGIVIDDVRSHHLVHEKLVKQSKDCGWERVKCVPALNADDLHAEMLAEIISDQLH